MVAESAASFLSSRQRRGYPHHTTILQNSVCYFTKFWFIIFVGVDNVMKYMHGN